MAASATDEPTRARRLLILTICSVSVLMVGLDNTIVNVALPSIHRELHASLSGLQWTIDAYTLVIATLLMLAGSTADRLGRRRVFQIGLVLFSTGSLLCALAPSLGALLAFRVVQAVGGSMLNPVAMSIIRTTFEDPKERAQAIGVWGGVAGLSFALGPIVGGALIAAASWRWIFLVNVPVALTALALTALYVPESRAPRPRRIDPVGQVLVMVALASLTYAIIEGHTHGWTSPEILSLFAVSVVSAATLAFYELRRPEPLIDTRFFASAPFSGASVIAICTFGAVGGTLFLETLYLQDVRGFSPLHAGLYLLPLAIMGMVLAPVSGRMTGNRGSRPSLIAAGIALVAGGAMFTVITTHTASLYLLAANLVFGIGFGFVNPPITVTAVAGMPPAQAGVAAAIASTSRQIGNTLGVAIVGAAVGSSVAHAIGPSFAVASHVGWWIVTALGGAVLVIGTLSTTRWALRTAEQTAERLGSDPVRTAVPVG
ncbi:MAG TPA: DHA2 family efflux MFS transporter permease subunit [Solirubrobacteraceae bacterium]|jgi:EmrB/QacA subfamily drug resistance transporter|nr:DHA2 family efflux MFS transporter permease subunit [Solirubrobacteraceae bacterium]